MVNSNVIITGIFSVAVFLLALGCGGSSQSSTALPYGTLESEEGYKYIYAQEGKPSGELREDKNEDPREDAGAADAEETDSEDEDTESESEDAGENTSESQEEE